MGVEVWSAGLRPAGCELPARSVARWKRATRGQDARAPSREIVSCGCHSEMKKDTKLVWTSDPEEAKRLREAGKLEPEKDLPPQQQNVRVHLDRKRRAGKTVTVVSGLQLSAESLAKLAQQLKKRCGSGGTARDAEIEIQGDHRETIVSELTKLGFKVRSG